jgi:hypothetical protein
MFIEGLLSPGRSREAFKGGVAGARFLTITCRVRDFWAICMHPGIVARMKRIGSIFFIKDAPVDNFIIAGALEIARENIKPIFSN